MNYAQSTMAILVVSALATTAALAAEKLIEDTPKAIDGIETVCDGITIANRASAYNRVTETDTRRTPEFVRG